MATYSFFTADGREGVITELGSTLLRSTRTGGINMDALSTEFELPEYSYSEPIDSKPDDYYAARRSGGHVSKLRK